MPEILKNLPYQKVISVALLAVVCLFAIKMILFLLDRIIKRSSLDPTIHKILRIAVKAVLLFIAVIIVVGSLGISVSSLVAALSVVGVAFSLAIQGFLSNVFGGIQIISNQPFHLGDYVEAGGESGTVREVGLFYTKLDTPDKKLIQIPNSVIANSNIINYSTAPTRRVDISVSAAYDNDVEKVKSVLLDMLRNHPLTLSGKDLDPAVHVNAYNESDINYIARAWCNGEDYWTVYFDIMDAVKPTFEKNGITMSYPHVNVHMIEKQRII